MKFWVEEAKDRERWSDLVWERKVDLRVDAIRECSVWQNKLLDQVRR